MHKWPLRANRQYISKFLQPRSNNVLLVSNSIILNRLVLEEDLPYDAASFLVSSVACPLLVFLMRTLLITVPFWDLATSLSAL